MIVIIIINILTTQLLATAGFSLVLIYRCEFRLFISIWHCRIQSTRQLVDNRMVQNTEYKAAGR